MKSSTSHSSTHPFGWCVVLLLVSMQSWGQQVGCISGNCVNGYGTYDYGYGGRYQGQFKDGERHGRGTYTVTYNIRGNSRYEGEWRYDKKHGQGTMLYSNGQHYEGEWKDGKQHGTGITTWPGNGKLFPAFDSRYEGEFKDGKRHGRGTLSSFGSAKTGIWEHSKFLGTPAEIEERARQEREERQQRDLKNKEKARIYNACILDKSKEYEMSVSSVAAAVKKTCRDIAENPSWLDKLRYD